MLAGCFLFAVSYDCCTSGVNYDRRHQLYPEYDDYSCIFSKVYGRRWVRFGSAAFFLGATLLITAGAVRYSEKQSAGKSLSILSREE
jgi:hypothetical protein